MVETGNLLSTCKFFLFDIFLKLRKTIIQIIYFYNLVLFPQFCFNINSRTGGYQGDTIADSSRHFHIASLTSIKKYAWDTLLRHKNI